MGSFCCGIATHISAFVYVRHNVKKCTYRARMLVCVVIMVYVCVMRACVCVCFFVLPWGFSATGQDYLAVPLG